MRFRLLASLLALPLCLGAQDIVCDKGDTEVVRLEFTGNASIPSAVLENGIATTASNWTRRKLKVIGTRYCLDRAEFPRDVIRLLLYYRNHGFLDVAVDTVVTPVGPRQVAVRFAITEGQPTRLSSLAITGLESVPEREAVERNLPLRAGGRFDRVALAAARDSLARRLRNVGYPDADVLVNYETDAGKRAAAVTLATVPGARARIGAVRVAVRPYGTSGGVDTSIVRRLSGLSTGAWYRERDLERAKRTLYGGQLFAQVTVEPDTAALRADSTLPVRIGVVEGPPSNARIGGGWGTIDCFRAYADYTHLNVGRTATRVDLRGRVSKLGVATGGLDALCAADARRDYFSKDLNYSAGLTVTPPVSARIGVQPSVTLFSERRSEYNAFLRDIPVGSALSVVSGGARYTRTGSYTLEYGKTEAFPALFCALFSACAPGDQATLQRLQRTAVVGFAFADDHTDIPGAPTAGHAFRGDIRHASRLVGSDAKVQFTRLTFDGSSYLKAFDGVVFAARLRLGAVLGPTLSRATQDAYVPAQERLYAGGASTVRGFRQNELGPVVYNAFGYDTVRADGTVGGNPADPSQVVYFRANPAKVGQRAIPVGGNALIVANIEGRFRSPILADYTELALFTDVGRVWNRGAATTLDLKSIQATPGIGLRVRSLIGLIRVDIGYNPYQRAAGSAYFDTPITVQGGGGQLFCVSPGNTLRVQAVTSGGATSLVQQSGSCPSDFQPPKAVSFVRRLAFQFSIGQAF